MRAALAALLLLVAPCAAAEAYVHGSLTPASQQVTLAPGDRVELPYDWLVEFENTTCTSPVEVGVSFIVASSPSWVGASFAPMGGQAFSPRDSGKTTLEIAHDSEGPRPIAGTIELSIDLHPYESANCSPLPQPLEVGASLRVLVTGGIDETAPPPPPAKPTPAPAALIALAALAAVAARRR